MPAFQYDKPARQPRIRGGRVATLRIRPADCMTIADLARLFNIPIDSGAVSFAAATSNVLANVCEYFRKQGVVPSRDGFEYTEVMKAFPQDARMTKMGYQYSEALYTQERPVNVQMLHATASPVLQRHERPITDLDPEGRRKLTRIRELAFLVKSDPMNRSEDEFMEYDALQKYFTEYNMEEVINGR